MTRHLVVMVKDPVAGRVKTRLGRDIGMTAAAWWFRHQLARLLRRVETGRWQVTLAVAPDRAASASRALPRHFRRRPQGTGDLGDRMGRVFCRMPPGPVVIIGADIPGILPRHLEDAFAALGRADVAVGPAPDGGYWLIGLARRRAVPPGLFRDVRWSSPHALEDTLATLPGHRIATVATLRDVDCGDDLRALSDAGR